MNNALFLILLLLYVSVLAVVGYFTSRGASNATFFNANKNANWLLVSFGMIGAPLVESNELSYGMRFVSGKFLYREIW